MSRLKKFLSFPLAIAAIMLTFCGVAHSELVGVTPTFPTLLYDNAGTLVYDPGSDLLSIDASAIAIRFASTEPPVFVTPSSGGSNAVTIRILVDEAGTLIGGSSGDDIIIEGHIDRYGDGTVVYDGVLLTGEVIEFGYLDSGSTTDTFDFRFEFKGGLLASSYVGMDIGVMLTSENSNFSGDFSKLFVGGAKGMMGPIDAVCSLDIVKTGCVILPPSPDPESDCKGDVTRMTLMYTGEGCGASSNSQDPTKVECSGDPAGASPVTIVATDKKGKKVWTTATDVTIGGTVLVDAATAGRDEITGDTRFEIFNGSGDKIQEIKFHTSCSQPLNAGDQFGSLRLVSLTTTLGGEVTGVVDDEDCITDLPYEGANVKYTYTVTNNGVTTLTNVSVIDDVLGEVTGSPIASILPGETVTLTQTVFVTQATTNLVDVTGTAFGIWQCEGGASAEITLGETQPPNACETMIQAVLLKYIGPDISGADIEIVAKKFGNIPIVYTGVDLTAGTLLSSPAENGWTVDASLHTKYGTDGLGATTSIFINGVEEVIHTSCSTPFVSQAPAPLNDPIGVPSSNWYVVNFVDK